MELPDWLRRVLLGVLSLAASFFLFVGFGLWWATPGGYHKPLLEELMPFASIFLALLLARGLRGWFVSRSRVQAKEREYPRLKFWGLQPLGAVVIWLIVWHRYW